MPFPPPGPAASRRSARLFLLSLPALCALAAPVLAEDENFAPALPPPAPALRGGTSAVGLDEPSLGVPVQSLFRDTGNPYLRALPQDPAPSPGFNLGSVQLRTQFRTGNAGLQPLFLQRGYAPEDADLKIGPLYLRLDSLSGALLYSDNVNLSSTSRQSGVISIVELGFSAILQLTESVRLAGAGTLVYLPQTGQVGIVAGTSNALDYGFALAAVPSFFAQLTWDTNIAGWPVIFSDEFSTRLGYYSLGANQGFGLFEGNNFNGQDRAGQYVFSPPRTASGNNSQDISNLQNTDASFEVISNRIGVLTERLFPGSVRLRAGAYHENLWYNQGNRGLPSLREEAYVSLGSERENLRFKPRLEYDAFRTSLRSGFDQTIRLVIQGPITDQIEFIGSVGYFLPATGRGGSLLWEATLDHEAGPYTHETLSFGRETSSFQDEIFTYETYSLRQILGPHLTGRLFFSHQQVEATTGLPQNRSDWLAGIQLSLTPGPRTQITASFIYTYSDTFGRSEEYLGRLALDYRLTETFYAHLFYQYERRDSDFSFGTFSQNLVLFQLTKYFH